MSKGISYSATISTVQGKIEMTSPDPITVSELKWLAKNLNDNLYDQFPNRQSIRKIRITLEYVNE